MMTGACASGSHEACRCELPGQDKAFARICLEMTSIGLIPGGYCDCTCHPTNKLPNDSFLSRHPITLPPSRVEQPGIGS